MRLSAFYSTLLAAMHDEESNHETDARAAEGRQTRVPGLAVQTENAPRRSKLHPGFACA